MSDDSREENVYMAKLAEQAERYDEVCAVPALGFPRPRASPQLPGLESPRVGFPRKRSVPKDCQFGPAGFVLLRG